MHGLNLDVSNINLGFLLCEVYFCSSNQKRACIVGQNQSMLDLMKSVSAVQTDVPHEFSETCELDKSKVQANCALYSEFSEC